MRLFHVTPRQNLASIGQRGIDPAFHKSGMRVCWYVTWDKLPWAFLHVCTRHKVGLEEVVAIEVEAEPTQFPTRGRGVHVNKEVVHSQFMADLLDVRDLVW